MRTILWIALAVFVAAYSVYAFATLDRRPDDVKVESLIQGAAAAVGEHDFSGAISCVSKHYSDDSGRTYDQLRMMAAQALSSKMTYSVSADLHDVRVNRDTASLKAKVMAKRQDGGTLYERDLTIHLARENGRHALLVPVKVWRVTKVDNLGIDLMQDWF